MSHRTIEKWQRGAARRLRVEMTDAERRLWHHIRAHRFYGASFRRQWPVGPFIADFVCISSRLVIEVDGGSHTEQADVVADERRTRWLEANGFRVVRYWNLDVLRNTVGVLDNLKTVLGQQGHDMGEDAD